MSKLSPFIALLRAELVDRGHLLLVGAASGVLALLMPLLPGLKGLDAGEVHTIAAWILAALIGSVVAIGLGATLVGSDLSEGRIGYYLSLPLSPAAVWWAKLIAASATTIGTTALILGPSLILHPDSPAFTEPFDSPLGWATGPIALVIVLLVSHTASIILRSRTAWLAFDAAGLAIAFALLWSSYAPLVEIGAYGSASRIGAWMIVLIPAALALAGTLQLQLGRGDLHRSHRVLSISCIALLTMIGLGSRIATTRILSPSPDALVGISSAMGAPHGSWIAITGEARKGDLFAPLVFMNRDTGQHVCAGIQHTYGAIGRTVQLSLDGQRAVVLEIEHSFPRTRSRVVVWDLGGSKPQRRATLLELEEPPYFLDPTITLSADGGRAALVEGSILTVYDLDQDRAIASFRIQQRLAAMWFEDRGTVRLITRTVHEPTIEMEGAQRLDAVRLDLSDRTKTVEGSLVLPGSEAARYIFAAVGPQGRQVLVQYSTPEPPAPGISDVADPATDQAPTRQVSHILINARSAERVAWADEAGLDRASTAALLPDGSIAMLIRKKGTASLRLADPASATFREQPLDGVRSMIFWGTTASDQLLATAYGSAQKNTARRTMLIDLESLRVHELPPELSPAGDPFWLDATHPAIASRPGSLENRIFITRDTKQLVLADENGTRQVLIDLR